MVLEALRVAKCVQSDYDAWQKQRWEEEPMVVKTKSGAAKQAVSAPDGEKHLGELLLGRVRRRKISPATRLPISTTRWR